MKTRLHIIDHKRGNPCDHGSAEPSHLYRVAVWVECPDDLVGKGPLSIFLLSRHMEPKRGWFGSNVKGAPCGGCPEKIEPLTHVQSAVASDEEALRSGKLLEFVIDAAGGQIPDSFTEEQVLEVMAEVVREVDAAFAEAVKHARSEKRALVGKTISPGGA